MKTCRLLIRLSTCKPRLIHRVGVLALGMSLLSVLACAQVTYTPYTFTTLAGKASIGSADGTGANARFYEPADVAVDRQGNIYVADTKNHTIREITASGYVETLAGLAGVSGSADGVGSAARFDSPQGICVDSHDNLLVADTGNHTVRKVVNTGPWAFTMTLAGSAGLEGSTDGAGSAARFNRPFDVAVDQAGAVYVADEANHTVRKITTDGVVTTVAGLAGVDGDTDGTGSAARFGQPRSLAVDFWGNLYVADDIGIYYGQIRKVTPAGEVTTLRNDGIQYPQGVAVDAAGNVYLSDTLRIMRLSPGGQSTTLTTLSTLMSISGAHFLPYPDGVAVDSAGNVLVADTEFSAVRQISPGGVMTTLAGSGEIPYGAVDGTGSSARFHSPSGVTADISGNVYVADSANHTIRKLSPDGIVTTLAGLAGTSGSADGTGSAARFSDPEGAAVDAQGNVYVADLGNRTIRKVTPDGAVTTLTGLAGFFGGADGTGSEARFIYPTAIAVDRTGTAYVADLYAVRKITPGGLVTTLAGLAGTSGTADGTGSAARFSRLEGIAVDALGNVYVSDQGAHTIRKISPESVVTTLAGMVHMGGHTDGTGGAASFLAPAGVAVDSSGNLYITEIVNATIRRVTPLGVVTTLAGLTQSIGSSDGCGSAARFHMPDGIAVDNAGRLYVADSGNHTIRMGLVATAPVILTQPQSLTVPVGSQAQFTVVAAGNPVPRYQWFFNGTPLVSYFANETLTIGTVFPGHSGTYTVTVTNDVGSVTSNAATLTVSAATPGPASTGASGGGAMEAWFIVGLVLLATARKIARRWRGASW